ncbi:hypothetical protein RIF23_19695 [Lipingzhangella sp. LS1_29]|uniref:DUF3558 domain-containing protein n=1 Tax=Lipingzhangella rawalii TaxID=2055835 RepID=A0ABU2HB17_9ACTN|nr:hypothetical protein [Lipingzhangella rawalii]MDS1272516.1 hypothetical protein [Lipingzhangella rawalii]
MPPGGYPPPKKSNLGLWIVLGGGLVIVVLIGLVVVMLVRGAGDDGPVATGNDDAGQQTAADDDTGSDDGDGDGDTDDDTDADDDTDDAPVPDTEVGEPPHALPDDACAGLSEDTVEALDAAESRTQTDDNRASCTWDVRGDVDIDGQITLTYQLPYIDNNSESEAASDFDFRLDSAMDESSDIIGYTVLEDEPLDLGDQAQVVFREVDSVWMSNEAILLIQQDNMLIEFSWTLDPDDILDDDAPAPADYEDVEDYLPDMGAAALDNMG